MQSRHYCSLFHLFPQHSRICIPIFALSVVLVLVPHPQSSGVRP